jgi:hypothetical protein
MNPRKEEEITEVVSRLGGALSCRETPTETGTEAVCLTYEFSEWDSAQAAAASLRRQGEHVEGPVSYGP